MFEPCLEVQFVDNFILVSVKQLKQLKYLFVHVLVFDDAALGGKYIETMAKNYVRLTLS